MFSFLRRAREQLTRSRVAADQDDEFRFHLEMETEKHLRLGMSPDEARRAAALAFGSKERFRGETHDARGFMSFENLIRDTRHAARRLIRSIGHQTSRNYVTDTSPPRATLRRNDVDRPGARVGRAAQTAR